MAPAPSTTFVWVFLFNQRWVHPVHPLQDLYSIQSLLNLRCSCFNEKVFAPPSTDLDLGCLVPVSSLESLLENQENDVLLLFAPVVNLVFGRLNRRLNLGWGNRGFQSCVIVCVTSRSCRFFCNGNELLCSSTRSYCLASDEISVYLGFIDLKKKMVEMWHALTESTKTGDEPTSIPSLVWYLLNNHTETQGCWDGTTEHAASLPLIVS